MPWVPPHLLEEAYKDFCRKIERLPSPLPEPHYDPPMTYYNNKKSCSTTVVPYDLFWNSEEGYDQRSARDDRRSLLPLFENIFKEEEHKYIPVTSQLWYGRPRLHEEILDWSARFGRASQIKDFYRRQGVNISPELEQQPTH